MLLEQVEALVERKRRLEREERRLGDLTQGNLARVASLSHHRANKGLARDHADEAPVVLDDEHRAHVVAFEATARVLRARGDAERRRLRQHRLANGLGHG